MGEIDKLGADAKCAEGGEFWRRPVAPSVFDYPGWQGPGHTSFPRHKRGLRADHCHSGGWKDSPRVAGGA
jgi:hypothetical protein